MFPNHLTAFDRFHVYGRDMFRAQPKEQVQSARKLVGTPLLAHTWLHTERPNFAIVSIVGEQSINFILSTIRQPVGRPASQRASTEYSKRLAEALAMKMGRHMLHVVMQGPGI